MTIEASVSFNSTQELVHGQPRLRDDGAQSSARNITGVTSNHRDFVSFTIDPELVTAFPWTQVFKTISPQARDYVTILERGQSAHAGKVTGNGRWIARALRLNARRSSGGRGSFSERYTSSRMRALACASSIVSARVRPCTTRPGRSVLVARKPPSASGSTFTSSTISVSIVREVKRAPANSKPQ